VSLYKIDNPESSNGIEKSTARTPACCTSPLCGHQVCNTSLSISERVAYLVNSLTEQEKIFNMVDASGGSERLGLPPYAWWNEATHGVGEAPGVQFNPMPGNFSYATSFPSPILSAATFDDKLIFKIGQVVGKEGRAFGNNGFSGWDFWAPNMSWLITRKTYYFS
jgi:beta-D-xylosidase 4